MGFTSILVATLACIAYTRGKVIYVDPKSFAVFGVNSTAFRIDAFSGGFNPTSTTPPFFQVFDTAFLNLLGPDARIAQIAANATYAFAHEAPVYVPETDEVFFASNAGGALGMSGLDKNNVVFKISLREAEAALASATNASEGVNVPITALDLAEEIQMTNGGTGPYRSSFILVNSGRGPRPPSIALVNPKAPYNSTVILDNFYGRQFNSLNDLKVHPKNGQIYFTDPDYGYMNRFRPLPLLPNQLYAFDPQTSTVRVIADQFEKCNGIAFDADGKIAYVSDTGAAIGFLGFNQTLPSTIYAYDVDPLKGTFGNRRVFAYSDAGIPDGIQVDIFGNVFSGCGDGVHVWDNKGTLLGKLFFNTTTANMVFAGPGRMVVLAETKVFLVHFAARGIELGGPRGKNPY
ncbi:D-lactonohydrolase-like protein [Cantharellus anzutake]|uniref:D-lactonohydrolase-like protein n=1 Tax=Cantharellus anzutake TaxID=1750568 RepID=UPI001906F74D|nr:D-lactonohydrolase-like protein [Cantharellus anzutake]XP_038923468.1 D-lactonohydrolase-like protein [Cantharellus anzutake]KAF8326185.1 D-lactonohydrolase-like protein [Cantharellus anzutake]KAF8343023.1 D-lactonohydrolase-like protein [Cantharellus anzutake]